MSEALPVPVDPTEKVPVTARRIDPESIILQNVTRRQWDCLCQYLAEGVKLELALEQSKVNIRHSVYRSIMRDDIAAREQVMNARADWDNRNWPEDLILEICTRIAMGDKLTEIADDEIFQVSAFHALRLRDDYVNELFMKARQIQAEGMVDEILEISDDDSNDMGVDAKGGDKPNTAAVQRARLQTDNRKWFAGRLLKEVYGDNVQVDATVDMVVDHAARLEEARNRKEAGHRRLAQKSVGDLLD